MPPKPEPITWAWFSFPNGAAGYPWTRRRPSVQPCPLPPVRALPGWWAFSPANPWQKLPPLSPPPVWTWRSCAAMSPWSIAAGLRDDAGVGVIKVFHVTRDAAGPETSDRAGLMRDFHTAGHLITLDRMVDGLQGGTGQTFDWDVAARLSGQGHDFLLAGGLTPENVGRAVAAVRPWGVDVSSGVETNGINDPDKIRAFVQNARNA